MAPSADRRLDIREGDGWATLADIDIETAAAIARLKIGSVTPLENRDWRVSNIRKVGALRVNGIELHVHPKVPVSHLFYLLARGQQWGEWYDSDISLSTTSDIYSAIAEVFGRWGERVLRGGVIKGYREVRSAEPVVRGRWLTTEQINRRLGMPLPAELQFDDFTVDIVENQLVRAATLRLLRTGGLPQAARARLHRIDRQLADATPLAAGLRPPIVDFDRRNERYRPIVALAQLVLGNESLEHHGGATTASGYLLDLARVFEDYVETEVRRHAASYGGEILAQHPSHLDVAGHAVIKPDLVWRKAGSVRAVFDAKYKITNSDHYPNADIYQMLAYCIRHGIGEGHLIYAEGDRLPTEIAIIAGEHGGSPVRVYAHAVDLTGTPASIEKQVSEIVVRALAHSDVTRTLSA